MINPQQQSLRKIFLFFFIILPLVSQAQTHQDWSYNLAIYEVNVRQYTQEGTFTAFENHLDRLQEMGVGILWFMPIHPIGKQNRLGTLGSYYSVRNYLATNPEFGSLDEFKALVQKIHERGMYVIIDWVANHTSWDNVLTTTHPEWYNTDSQGNFIPPPGTDWSDVIDLDYSQPGLRTYMIDAMKFWVNDVGVDGFRCDAVDKVPVDFWQTAISELKSLKPDLFMVAEADGIEWHEAGFDMTYAWGFYGFGSNLLINLVNGSNNASHLNSYALTEKNRYSGNAYRMYFTANHDENSWYGTTDELFGDAAEMFAVLAATLNGMPLIYSGQEAGLDKRLQFFEKDQIIWKEHENATLYTRLLQLKRENHALWNGDRGSVFVRVPTSNNSAIFAFVREKDGHKIFVILNTSGRAQNVTLLKTDFTGDYLNLFTGESVKFEEGDNVSLEAWDYQVYELDAANSVALKMDSSGSFNLSQNYPNPFNPQTQIWYELAQSTNVELAIYDILGRQITLLLDAHQVTGKYEITWLATDEAGNPLPSGIYWAKLKTDVGVQIIKMSLIR